MTSQAREEIELLVTGSFRRGAPRSWSYSHQSQLLAQPDGSCSSLAEPQPLPAVFFALQNLHRGPHPEQVHQLETSGYNLGAEGSTLKKC